MLASDRSAAMSFYLYGEFHFSKTLSPVEQESLAFGLSDAALRARICVRLGLNIIEREVFETLKRSDGGLSTDSMAFLVTDSPLSNTSDEILEPHNVMPLDMERVIRERLRCVEAFLKSAKDMNIKGLSLTRTPGPRNMVLRAGKRK